MKKAIIVQSVEILHTNPSMGPHEKKVSISLNNSEPLKKYFHGLISDTKVNGKVSLKEYIELVLSENNEKIKKIRDAYKPEYLNEGETISELTLTLDSGEKVGFSDLRRVQLSGYFRKEFLPVLIKAGTRVESGADDDLIDHGPAIRPVEDPETSD